MKITSNSVGNYTFQHVRSNSVKPVKAKETEAVKDNIKSDRSNAGLSREEKKFFVTQYPGNKTEIMDYHYYRKNGKMAGVKVGSLIDKRG